MQQSFNLYHRENIKHYSFLLSRTGSQTHQRRTDPLMSFLCRVMHPFQEKWPDKKLGA